MVRLTDRPDMTLGVYRGRKTTTTTVEDIFRDKVLHGLVFVVALKCYVAHAAGES